MSPSHQVEQPSYAAGAGALGTGDEEQDVGVAYSHVAIVVADLAASAAFYRNVLGFRSASGTFRGSGSDVEQIMGVDGARIEGLFMAGNGFVIELLHYDHPDSAGQRSAPTEIGYGHLSFVVDSVADRMLRAERWGGAARHDSRTAVAMGRSAPVVMGFVADPDGNLIELIEHPDDDAAAGHGKFLRAASIGWPPRLAASRSDGLHDDEAAR